MNVTSLSPWHDAPWGSEMPRDTDVQPGRLLPFPLLLVMHCLGVLFKNKAIQSAAIGGDGDDA